MNITLLHHSRSPPVSKTPTFLAHLPRPPIYTDVHSTLTPAAFLSRPSEWWTGIGLPSLPRLLSGSTPMMMDGARCPYHYHYRIFTCISASILTSPAICGYFSCWRRLAVLVVVGGLCFYDAVACPHCNVSSCSLLASTCYPPTGSDYPPNTSASVNWLGSPNAHSTCFRVIFFCLWQVGSHIWGSLSSGCPPSMGRPSNWPALCYSWA